jgi:enediyne biosynthesis protein E4
LPFARNLLYRNEGGGKFVDVSKESGISEPFGHYALGVVSGDYNNDGWPDLYVACDQTPSLLYINQRNGKFEEEAVLRGAAFDENGRALSGMGVTAGDFDGDGWLDLFRTNFSDERETLYRNRGDAEFDDVTAASGMARNTRFVGWGCMFFDHDLDGWLDLLLVNGHVFPEVDRLNLPIKYRDRAILYRNNGRGGFVDVSESFGPAVLENHSARGLAVGDLDNDGSLEVLINNQNEPPSLWKQSGGGNWILLDLGSAAMGAKVRLTAGGRTQVQEVRSGGSYLSQSDLRLHFGLGKEKVIDRIEVQWPGTGQAVQVLEKITAGQVLKIAPPSGPRRYNRR